MTFSIGNQHGGVMLSFITPTGHYGRYPLPDFLPLSPEENTPPRILLEVHNNTDLSALFDESLQVASKKLDEHEKERYMMSLSQLRSFFNNPGIPHNEIHQLSLDEITEVKDLIFSYLFGDHTARVNGGLTETSQPTKQTQSMARTLLKKLFKN